MSQQNVKASTKGEDNWVERELPYIGDAPLLGFLQLCADRRFHSLIQSEFQTDAKLNKSTDYWIHADAGGTPKMEDLTIAPNYCYKQKKVRLMGWSAHGAGCGGFGEEVPDDVIRKALQKTFKKQRRRYPKAKHFCYFVTIKKMRDKEKAVCFKLAGK
ncbi:MAG TPA: hypothetical protein VJM12_21695 [Pyrinomonadaceae bacterium]|nr:hypothetical protein [Pyrinomonadaceae bacterium]